MKQWCSLLGVLALAAGAAAAGPEPHPVREWVKRHPREKAEKPSPRMGYETTYGYDPARKLLIRYSGHNQGGGGEQNSEVWTYDLDRDLWALKEPNDAPPGVCCGQQNVFDDALGKFLRFPSFSGSHGWQSWREIYLKDSSVWTYDLPSNAWRPMRPCPEVRPSPLRGAAWDPRHEVTVIHGGEGSEHGTVVYDLYANAWHEMKPRPAPDANVSQPGFTFDAVHRRFVLFGAQFQSDPRTWAYDLRRNSWEALGVAERPPADKSCPVLAADTRNGVVLCSVIGSSGLETWVLDVAKPAWTRLTLPREPDTSGSRNRVLLYLPDRNLFVLENRTRDEQQIWTFRYAAAPPPPPRPERLRVTTTAHGATLAWDAPPDAKNARYTVLRGQGKTSWEADLRPIAEDLRETTFEDRDPRPDAISFYRVRAASDGKDAGESGLARTQPSVPLHPRARVAGPRDVELQWAPPAVGDVAGYHVERADTSVYSAAETRRFKDRFRDASDQAVGRVKAIGRFRRLTSAPLARPVFRDDTPDLASGQKEPADLLQSRPLHREQVDPQGKKYRFATYAYRIVAVNRRGVESGPSPLVFTWPAAVEQVFAKEEGEGAARIKWQPSGDSQIAGYHVYRHDGRWDKDTITRLTARPVQATEFLDETSGKSTRRYEVVAVDALGQEGEPSQPVWSRREWRRYYAPYAGEWHQ